MSTPSRDQNKFIIRMPDGLRDRIAAAAKEAGRSMNSEIVRTLETVYAPLEEDARELFAYMVAVHDGTAQGDKQKAIDAYTDFMKMPRGSLRFQDGNVVIEAQHLF